MFKFQEHAKGVAYNLIANLIVAGGAGVISWYTAHQAITAGIPRYTAILIGIGAFAVLAFAFAAISLGVSKWRTKNKGQDPPIVDPKLHENCERTISNHESTIRRLQGWNETQGVQISSRDARIQQLEAELGGFEWLREIADNQIKKPLDYVRANDCWIVDNELLDEPLFIDVRCLFYSSLVFSLDITGVDGALRFANRRLTGKCIISEKQTESLAVGDAGGVIIRQPLSRNEAAAILSRHNSFYFDQLSFDLEFNAPQIKGHATISPDCEIDNKELRTKYPQLRFKIESANYDPIPNAHDWSKSGIDTVITLKLELENPRKQDVFIETVRLAVTVDNQNRVVTAETQDILQPVHIDQDKTMMGRQVLKNLGKVPLIIVGHGKVQGHFEFTVDGLSGSQAENSPISLILTDRFGETHVVNFTPTAKHV